MSYQKVTGTLMANSHPGSYCGQDAYNDMFVTEKKNDNFNKQGGLSHQSELQHNECACEYRLQRSAYDFEGGYDMDTAVRRLMPIECERLQGYEDNWTLIGEPEENPKTGEIEYFYIDSSGKKKKVSDSARYKALGNSICLPFWEWMARRICSQYERKVTMGSLFDGIGGFPLVFQNVGAFPIWASEIEEFPMAVTKERFPEDD